jgi:hypothetical protein
MLTSDLAPFVSQQYVEFMDNKFRYVASSGDEFFINSDESKFYGTKVSIVGPEKKFLITLQDNFFHALANTITNIWREHKINKDVLFVFSKGDFDTYVNIQNKNMGSIYSLFFKLLDKNNINYVVVCVDTQNNHLPNELRTYLEINNFYYIQRRNSKTSPVELKEVMDLLLDLVVGEDRPAAEKKVYLTRKHADPGIEPEGIVFPEHIVFKDDKRIHNEELVEQYFKDLGFEIIVPEDFPSFSDQIKYMASAKTIASATSSGLYNSFFMNDGGLLVELLTPLYRNFGGVPDKSIHSYTYVTYLKKHTHICIPHDRDPLEILKAIESKPYFKNLLEA